MVLYSCIPGHIQRLGWGARPDAHLASSHGHSFGVMTVKSDLGTRATKISDIQVLVRGASPVRNDPGIEH